MTAYTAPAHAVVARVAGWEIPIMCVMSSGVGEPKQDHLVESLSEIWTLNEVVNTYTCLMQFCRYPINCDFWIIEIVA